MNIQSFDSWEIWVFLLCGLAVLFAGYRIKKIAFFIIWFLIGVRIINYMMPSITSALPQILDNPLWQNLLPIAGGLLLALLGFSIEKLCVGGICFGITFVIVTQYFGTEMQTLLIGGILGIIAAGIGITLMKPAIIVATSLAGAYALTMGLIVLTNLDGNLYYWPILAGLTVLGSIVQFSTTRHIS